MRKQITLDGARAAVYETLVQWLHLDDVLLYTSGSGTFWMEVTGSGIDRAGENVKFKAMVIANQKGCVQVIDEDGASISTFFRPEWQQ